MIRSGSIRWAAAVLAATCWTMNALADEKPAAGTQYYVAPGGDDANAGTSAEKPLKTIAKAASLVQAGDTVNLAPGTYTERVKIERSGTAEAPITLRRQGQGEVVWTTADPEPKRFQDKYALDIEGQQYIVVEGLTFRDCTAWIMLWESNHCTIRDCTFDGVKIYNALRINSGSFNRILNCRFVRSLEMTSFREEANWIPTPGCDYIEIHRSSHNNLVEGCTFGKITHTAVSISATEKEAAQHSPSRNIVRKNVFRDPFWKCLWFYAGQHNVFEDNLCIGSAANFIQLESATSIIRRNRLLHYRDSTGGKPEIELRGVIRIQYDQACHNRLYANLFYDCERVLTNNSYRWTVTDNEFKNNIFYGNSQTVYLGFSDYTTKNRNRFVSNVVVQKSPGEKLIRLVKDEFTLAEAQQKLPDLYRGNLEVDPLLDVKGDDVVGLKAGSPCLDAGAALTVTTADGQGVDVPVEDPLYFCDGFGLIDGDRIVVGANAAAKLVKVDYEKRVLTLDRAITWKKGDAVNLPYAGQGPDIGPFEAGAAGGEGAAAASGQDTSEAKVPTNKETEMAKAGAAKAGGPRKIIVGSCMYSMWGPFPGFDERLKQMGGLIDDMVKKAKEKYGPDAQLDLAALPEYCITSGKKGPAKDRCVPLEGPVLDYFGAKAREHKTYIVVAMELADDAAHGGCTNAAVLIDRAGKLVGIYRKVHAVANVGDTSLEGGMAPGTETPVFQCDFGKVGMQICYDIGYDDGWAALAKQGAELVVWPTQSPQTIQPAARALTHGYYIVSSTWRNNASLFDPTGAVIAQITKPEERVLVERIDLSYALLPWQPKLNNGKLFTEKYGDRAGYRYSEREDGGIFWSNDPAKPIGEMVRELGLATQEESLRFNTCLRERVLNDLKGK